MFHLFSVFDKMGRQ